MRSPTGPVVRPSSARPARGPGGRRRPGQCRKRRIPGPPPEPHGARLPVDERLHRRRAVRDATARGGGQHLAGLPTVGPGDRRGVPDRGRAVGLQRHAADRERIQPAGQHVRPQVAGGLAQEQPERGRPGRGRPHGQVEPGHRHTLGAAQTATRSTTTSSPWPRRTIRDRRTSSSGRGVRRSGRLRRRVAPSDSSRRCRRCRRRSPGRCPSRRSHRTRRGRRSRPRCRREPPPRRPCRSARRRARRSGRRGRTRARRRCRPPARECRNTSRVAVELTTSAAAVAPMRTCGSSGRASPVIVTRVPPAVATRIGLMPVMENGPTPG